MLFFLNLIPNSSVIASSGDKFSLPKVVGEV
jgi:hypothetical protein